MISMANAGTPVTKVYEYNDGNQLTKVGTTSGITVPLQRHYFYDPAGRLSRQHQLIMFATPVTKRYDYQWDARDMLTKAQIVAVVAITGTKTLQYDYNTAGQRIRRTDIEGAVTKLYTYQGNSLASVQTSPYGSGNDMVYTSSGGLVSNILERHVLNYGSTPTPQYYQYNHRGDVVAVTDSSGNMKYGYHYDAFGNIIFDHNSGGGSAPTDDLFNRQGQGHRSGALLFRRQVV
jgi:YD repeat-containing protein